MTGKAATVCDGQESVMLALGILYVLTAVVSGCWELYYVGRQFGSGRMVDSGHDPFRAPLLLAYRSHFRPKRTSVGTCPFSLSNGVSNSWNRPVQLSERIPWCTMINLHVRALLMALVLQSASALVIGQEIADVKKRAESGDVKAQVQLGIAYAAGNGITQDGAEAVKWLRKAADHGDADST